MKLKIRKFLLSVIIFFICTFVSFAQEFTTGIWQGMVEGGVGEGDTFYVFDFNDNGKVKITKQFSGMTLIEEREWLKDGSLIKIISKASSKIADFDNRPLKILDRSTLEQENQKPKLIITQKPNYMPIVHLFFILFILLLLNEIFRHSKWVSWLFFGILPLVLIPLWLNSNIAHWFRWVKLYSVAFAALWFTFIRFTKLGNFKFARFIAAAFLCVNIFEAVTQDFTLGYLPNVLNAFAGLLNIITLAYWSEIHADDTKFKDMVWPKMTLLWIIAYDIWNWTFVYLNFPGHASFHFMVLLACTLPVLNKHGVWLQARAFTLGCWMMYLFTFQSFIDSTIIALPRSYTLMVLAGSVSLGINILYAVIHFKKRIPELIRISKSKKQPA